MATTYPVKYIHEGMRGAPVLSPAVGTMISLLDAFLLTGFGLTTAVSVSVSSGVATAALQPGESFEEDCVVLVDGATPAVLNGEARVLSSSNSSITWATTAPDGVATGTITIKVAPVGSWEKVFSGTNKAIYRSTDPDSYGGFLRVEHTTALYPSVRGYASMSDVDSGSGAFPTTSQMANPSWPIDVSSVSGAGRAYQLFADSRFLGVAIAAYSESSMVIAADARGFGDFLGDAYCVGISVMPAGNITIQYSGAFSAYDKDQTYGMTVTLRDAMGVAESARGRVFSYVGNRTPLKASGNQDTALGPFPSPIDGRLRLSRLFFTDTDNLTPRAEVPGIYFAPHSALAARFTRGAKVAGEGDLVGHTLMAVPCTDATISASATGFYFIDITGPWR